MVGTLPAPSHASRLPRMVLCCFWPLYPRPGFGTWCVRSWVFTPEQGPDPVHAELCFCGRRGSDCAMRGDQTQALSWGSSCSTPSLGKGSTLLQGTLLQGTLQGRSYVSPPAPAEVTSSKCHLHHVATQSWEPLLCRVIQLSH